MKTLVIYGFLGCGKTTLINYLLSNIFKGKHCVVLENESGTESIDGEFLRDGGCRVVDMRAGCICCSLRTELPLTVEKIKKNAPDILLIEPSGIAALEDILSITNLQIDGIITLIDVQRFPLLMKLNEKFYHHQFGLSQNLFLTKIEKVKAEDVHTIKARLSNWYPLSYICEDYTKLTSNQWESVLWNFMGERSSVEEEHHNHNNPTFDSVTYILQNSVDFSSVEDFFKEFENHGLITIRVKALMNIEGTPSKLDYSMKELSITPMRHLNKASISFWWEKKQNVAIDYRHVLDLLLKKYFQ
jgi:G3E family GTPase